MSESNSIQVASTQTVRRRIVKTAEYEVICDFIQKYQGLAIDCELELINKFPDFEKLTLKCILETILTNRMRSQYWRYDANAKTYLKMYEERCQKSSHLDRSILLGIAREADIGPVMMCRSLLKVKYKITAKEKLTQLIRSPHLIKDHQFSANVAQCVCSDSQDGPLIALRRRVLGEEYEFKLKQMANMAGMHYYDEHDLRRLGYDKTPDIKMLLPFLYKGEVINWIESKANFGNIKSHKTYIQQQLNSYCNRFGAGIVIYWFGYQEETATLPDNSMGIIVLDDFPAKADIQLLDLTDDCESYDSTKPNNCDQKPIT
ncbi:CDAN1-interacting nuclease 1 [Stomoxys calcitrans]|uniref:CDAN1-interacting nuclease 1 n=1 Tax=Stomoxys calcitrans TaxID=35570 RepID=A0A1I8PUU0_STOCA|nr:CDAN1-interacting nuclease 1 [Stomoxys calcitrans]